MNVLAVLILDSTLECTKLKPEQLSFVIMCYGTVLGPGFSGVDKIQKKHRERGGKKPVPIRKRCQ